MLFTPDADSDQQPYDGLYLERFQVFMDKIIADIQAFSDREIRSFDQTRRDVTKWHLDQLFASNPDPFHHDAFSVLLNVSNTLQSLQTVFNYESFVLAVNPTNPTIQPFLGGTLNGREFWRGMRSGGDSGAKAFKEYCSKALQANTLGDISAPTASCSKQPSRNVKEELYHALTRSVSGIRNAEMKWTNHERLSPYGVQLVGWPPDIPLKNPSSLKADQNKRLLELINSGSLKFMENIVLPDGSSELQLASDEMLNSLAVEDGNEGDQVFSWAIQYQEEDHPLASNTDDANVAPVPTPAPAPAKSEYVRPKKRVKYGERIRFLESHNVKPP
ncbi:hypothetical protein D9757_007996 [Collybiopsis confluens]|uniref:Uncharacterized protein n=1 Tax=Collybiopsis confluens TaxID=2823264 RepID=A0A8H5H688_9AGAR|nr:hypothetical protein D9757_007996 [Collybiopsis confluens]